MFRTYSDEDLRGMRITSGKVVIRKDDGNLIGISIGGGAPLCPCLYVVQVFDNTPAARDGTLESGDEIVGVNGTNVKGKTKVEVARMIQNKSDEVVISYNKLHAEPKQGKSLDIVLKKVKHKMVESMSSSTADALGLSRAILCNDSLVKKLDELERTEDMYRGLVSHTRRVLLGYYDLVRVCKELGDEFYKIGVREPQPAANRAFCEFGEYHRQMEKFGISMLRQTKPILSDLGTYLTKAIPDTKLTIKRYADVKFEYLSYCLKVKEFDDEDYSYQALQEPLYRVETGNYEYRLILRCRADARKRFASMRSDVLVKLELLDNKHVQDIVHQLRRLMESLTEFHIACHKMFDGVKLFPIEVELGRNAFQYNTSIYTDEDTEVAEDVLDDDKLINAVDTVPESDSLIGLNFTAPTTLLEADLPKTGLHNDNFNSAGEHTSTLLMGDNDNSLLGGNYNPSLLIGGDKDLGLMIGGSNDSSLNIGGNKDPGLMVGGSNDFNLLIGGNNDSSLLIDRNNASGPLTNVGTSPSLMFGQTLGSSQFIAGHIGSSHVVGGDNESSLLIGGNKDASPIIVSNTDTRNDNCSMFVPDNSSIKDSHRSLMSQQIRCVNDHCIQDQPKETNQSFSSMSGKGIASTGVKDSSKDQNYSTSNRATNEEEIDEWCLPDPEP